jgi:hypothetical protein
LIRLQPNGQLLLCFVLCSSWNASGVTRRRVSLPLLFLVLLVPLSPLATLLALVARRVPVLRQAVPPHRL